MTGRRLVDQWGELALVIASAIVGFVLKVPGRALVDRGAINIVLFVLVLAAASSLPRGQWAELRTVGPRLAVITAVTVVVLPAVAYLAARIVPVGPERLGVMALGVAPAEIATVAFAAAAGAGATAGVLLLASTVLSVATAAPILALMAGAGTVRASQLLVTLLVVVLVPFVLGSLVAQSPPSEPGSDPTSEPDRPRGSSSGLMVVSHRVASGAVVVLVGLVATQVSIDRGLPRVAVALIAFIAAGAALGTVVAGITPVRHRPAIVLSLSMRDFAVASGIAAAAFGPAAAAPLGLYGILVMLWGAMVTTRHRRRSPTLTPRADSGPAPTA